MDFRDLTLSDDDMRAGGTCGLLRHIRGTAKGPVPQLGGERL